MFSYQVKVFPFKGKGTACAFATIIVDEIMEVKGFTVMNGRDGLWVSAPRSKGKDKEGNEKWFDDVYFVGDQGKEIREEIFQQILEEYQKVTSDPDRKAQTTAARGQAKKTTDTTQRRDLW